MKAPQTLFVLALKKILILTFLARMPAEFITQGLLADEAKAAQATFFVPCRARVAGPSPRAAPDTEADR